MVKATCVLVAVSSFTMSKAYEYIASTTRYGDTSATACGGLDTVKLRAGTEYFVVAASQSMMDAFPSGHACEWRCDGGSCQQVGDCWCGSSSGSQRGTDTAPMGCFTCAKGRFIRANPYNGVPEDRTDFQTEEIKVVVADICPFGSNAQWCPSAPGQVNQVGKANHLDFTMPPSGIDNHYFVFTPEPCSEELQERMSAAASCQGGLPEPPRPPAPSPRPPAPSPMPGPSSLGVSIWSELSGKCLGLVHGAAADGADVHMWRCSHASPGVHQRWLLHDGQVKYVEESGREFCLDVPANERYDGQRLQLWSCAGSPQQRFRYEQDGGAFTTEDGAKCLDLKDGSLEDGAAVQLWSCAAGNANQQWGTSRLSESGPAVFM